MKLNELFQVMNLDLADTNAKERELRSKVVAKLIELVEEEPKKEVSVVEKKSPVTPINKKINKKQGEENE